MADRCPMWARQPLRWLRGAADAVLYSSRDALGEPTRQVLASHRPVRMLVAEGPAAVSQDVLTSATGSAGVVLTGRLGGSTRVETAALVAQSALDGGATTAVIANGWSLPDVGIAAGLAAALPNSVVLYTNRGSLGAATETALTEHTIKHVFLVGAVDADTTHLMSLVPSKLPLTRITTAAHASLHAVGTAAPASQSRFVAISAGPSFTCGIGLDAMVECWGNPNTGVNDVPAGSFTEVSAGGRHACGLRTDGTIECWGKHARGEPDGLTRVFVSPPRDRSSPWLRAPASATFAAFGRTARWSAGASGTNSTTHRALRRGCHRTLPELSALALPSRWT